MGQHGPAFFGVSPDGAAIFYYENRRWNRCESVQNTFFYYRNGTTSSMPQLSTAVEITSDEDDISVEDTNGSQNVPQQTGHEARDRRHSNGSADGLFRRALLPYVIYKIFSKSFPFPMAH